MGCKQPIRSDADVVVDELYLPEMLGLGVYSESTAIKARLDSVGLGRGGPRWTEICCA